MINGEGKGKDLQHGINIQSLIAILNIKQQLQHLPVISSYFILYPLVHRYLTSLIKSYGKAEAKVEQLLCLFVLKLNGKSFLIYKILVTMICIMLLYEN